MVTGDKMNALFKSTIREIKNGFGRYLAIFIIIALGVGFFAGLRACRPALLDTAEQYFEAQNFYDYRLLSSVGFPKDSISLFSALENISGAEGVCYEDVIIESGEEKPVFRVYSVMNRVNKLHLVSGRLPENENECVVDADYFGEEVLGRTFEFSEDSGKAKTAAFTVSSFTVVGTVTTPLYISRERDTTFLGDGKIAAFIFVPESCFTADYFKEIYLSLKNQAEIYSDAYRDMIRNAKDAVTESAKIAAGLYFTETPDVYVLTRNENAGYAAFEQDSVIIEKISVVFPFFFFFVAALVCATTMTRMVEEQRTQIGVFKAMGYSSGRISCKYLFYAASAGLFGSVFGFFAGTGLIPLVFWGAYRASYNFADMLLFSFDPVLYGISLTIALLCTAGVTVLCCRKTLREVPASILRPKTPKSGRHILLERFGGFWRHVSFLYKVSLRNVVRFRQRFILMLLGIGGCTALLLTGFGIRDSVQNVSAYQYGEITCYDAEVAFSAPVSGELQKRFLSQYEEIDSVLFLSACNAEITAGGGTKSVKLTASASGTVSPFMDLHAGEVPVAYPRDGEVVLCRGIAGKLRVSAGDTVTLTDDSFHRITAVVTGVFDNYVGNYVFVSEGTMTAFSGESPVNTAYVNFKDDADPALAAAALMGSGNINHVALNADNKEKIETSFSSLNLVVILIIFCAGILAFVVLFHLININLEERKREIATLRVLGFFEGESSSYIFREVNIPAILGTLLGLLLGQLLHVFVMAQIKPDGICFDCRIAWSSYIYSAIITIIFVLLVRIVMRGKLKKINMAESLKSAE